MFRTVISSMAVLALVSSARAERWGRVEYLVHELDGSATPAWQAFFPDGGAVDVFGYRIFGTLPIPGVDIYIESDSIVFAHPPMSQDGMSFTGLVTINRSVPPWTPPFLLPFAAPTTLDVFQGAFETGGTIVTERGRRIDQVSLTVWEKRGDLNHDSAIDAADAGELFANWGGPGPADFDNSGVTDAADASEVFARWTGDGAVVPEPASIRPAILLLLLGMRSWPNTS